MTDNDKALVEELRINDTEIYLPLLGKAANRIEAQAAEIEALKTLLAATAQVAADHFKTAKERAAEMERLREAFEIAHQYVTDLEQHEGAEGFSVSTFELGDRYHAARAALGETE